MCFSAEASFVAGAILVPGGLLAIRTARQVDRRYLGFACFPLFFGIQQISEGIIWLSIEDGMRPGLIPPALVFLFFGYGVWPFWVPLSARMVEADSRRRWIFAGLAALGLGLGLMLFLPVLIYADTLKISLIRQSILYEGTLIFPSDLSKIIIRLIYSGIICIPLVASNDPGIRQFGYLIVASVMIGFLFASYAFTSIWCFLAAIVSIYLVFLFHGLKKLAGAARPGPPA